MSMESKKNTVLVLKYIGEDFWSMPVYQDQFNHLWKDVELGGYNEPVLYAPVNNEFEGEPSNAITQEFIIEHPNPTKNDKRFQYQMLDMLRSRCDYHLGYGNRNHIQNVQEHIDSMKTIWLSFSNDEKPKWLTWEKILEYEKEMCEEQ